MPFLLPPTLKAVLGAESDQLLTALQEPAPVSVRLNPSKATTINGEPVPWCSTGLYLEERPVFTLDPLFHAGAYYVQEAGSMLLEQGVRVCAPPADAVVLDLCAAPGGKATHLASLLAPEALLVCNEPVRSRQPILQENLWKWGRPDTVITGSLPQDLAPLGACFDLIVVDAPCSGEGMFRKDPFAREQWSERLVESCALQQRGILDAAWEALRPGGSLIYSTCTWEERENEDQVRRLVEKGGTFLPLPLEPAWGIETSELGYRCYPHKVRAEGFFLAVVRKPGRSLERPVKSVGANSVHPELDGWSSAPDQAWKSSKDDVLHAISKRWSGTVDMLGAHLRLFAPGVPVAVRKGNGWKPHPALALSTLLGKDAFPLLPLNKEDALQYLRGAALGADPSNGSRAEGVRLAGYAGRPIGWVTGAGQRWNNGWPAPWRIRMR